MKKACNGFILPWTLGLIALLGAWLVALFTLFYSFQDIVQSIVINRFLTTKETSLLLNLPLTHPDKLFNCTIASELTRQKFCVMQFQSPKKDFFQILPDEELCATSLHSVVSSLFPQASRTCALSIIDRFFSTKYNIESSTPLSFNNKHILTAWGYIKFDALIQITGTAFIVAGGPVQIEKMSIQHNAAIILISSKTVKINTLQNHGFLQIQDISGTREFGISSGSSPSFALSNLVWGISE